MASKILLLLAADRCHACTWNKGALNHEQSFANDAQGRQQFAVFLQAQRAAAYLLTDLAEEDFRCETVPHVRGSERSIFLQRKLEQYYRNTPFRLAVPLYRHMDGRRDDEVLLCALTNPALISPWLSIMLAHGMALAGVYSLPHISASLIRDIHADHLLLLSWEKQAGLRQTYFAGKLLRLSRLTPISDGGSFGAAIATEAARTQQYLKSLDLIAPGQTLHVHIICHVRDRQQLHAQLHDSGDMQFSFLDIQQLGSRSGSRSNYSDSDATPLFLHLLAARPPRTHYAAAEHTRIFQMRQWRHSLLWLSALLAAGCLLWSGINIREQRGLTAASASLREQAGQLSRQAQQVSHSVSAAPDSAIDMKSAVLMLRTLDSPAPHKILHGLSKTLNDFPLIRIDKLSWQASAGPSNATADAAAPVILLDGELEEFSGDYRSALNYLAGFQQALARSGHSVTARMLPLDISPHGSIAANDSNGKTKSAQFSFQIICCTPIIGKGAR